MGFSQSGLLSVNDEVLGAETYVYWTTSNPADTWWQVYVDESLQWWGQRNWVYLPTPSVTSRVDIGWVLPGEEQTNFSAELPPGPLRQTTLSWYGGTFESPEIAGFYVYGESSPGGGISYTAPLATITAYPAGLVNDGYGVGGYGVGGYGTGGGLYTWGSLPANQAGVWHWAVAPFDSAGNIGPAVTTSVLLAIPPNEPGLFSDNTRLHYTYNATNHEATLTWNASPIS